jgi:hypothetical protein
MIYRAPVQFVSVRVPFVVLVLSGACSVGTAWRLSRGAMTSPYYQKQILECADEWQRNVVQSIRNIWNLISRMLRLSGRGTPGGLVDGSGFYSDRMALAIRDLNKKVVHPAILPAIWLTARRASKIDVR